MRCTAHPVFIFAPVALVMAISLITYSVYALKRARSRCKNPKQYTRFWFTFLFSNPTQFPLTRDSFWTAVEEADKDILLEEQFSFRRHTGLIFFGFVTVFLIAAGFC
jgi:hypothetical protein